MPKTLLSAKLETQQHLDRLVRMYASANRTSISECAKRMKVGQDTLYRRLRNPSDFTLAELRSLRSVLGIPHEEMMERYKDGYEVDERRVAPASGQAPQNAKAY